MILKTIGLLGGMSWESSAEYYQIINETIAKRLGGNHSAKCLMYSFDFAEIEELQKAGSWKQATVSMIEAARSLEKGGAEFLVICTNTMHKMADEVQQSIQIPLLHIVDVVAEQVIQQKHRRIGLLGTMFTMEEAFYKERLSNRYKLEVLIPEKSDRQIVHQIIYNELVSGKILSSSRDEYKRIIASLVSKGAEAIVLGCTEIGLLIKNNDSTVPLFDTTKIHALAAVEYALKTER
jgi:aspartate racemase